MFVVSMKMSTIKVACILLALCVVITIAVWPRGDVQASAMLKKTVTGISTNEKRIEFIKSYGWEVDESPVEVVEIEIPETFNEVYQNYNSIQKKQGFDLSAYKGKRVKRWTYNITNYPGVSEEVRINLLIYDSCIIGGDVSTVALDGFMHGFSAPDTKTAASGTQTGVLPSTANIVSGVLYIAGQSS